MGFETATWVDRESEFPNRRILTPTANANEYDVTRSEGLILEDGTPLNAANLNGLETRIAAGFNDLGTQIYTQTKTGVKINLKGSGANGRVLVTAAYEPGDAIHVNGLFVATVTGADSALTEDNFGTWVTFIYDGTNLNFTTGQMQSYADTKTYTKKIYENASLSSSFLPQTLAFELTDYDGVDIYYMTSTSHKMVQCTRVLKGPYPGRLLSATSILWLRDVTVSNAGITFAQGIKIPSYNGSETDNSGIIPYQIHAFKGVQ